MITNIKNEEKVCNMTDEDIKRTYKNEKNIAVILEKQKNTNVMLCQIRDNHIPHLMLQVSGLETKMEAGNKELEQKLDALETVQDKQSPLMKWGEKVIETVLIGIVVAVMVLIGIGTL